MISNPIQLYIEMGSIHTLIYGGFFVQQNSQFFHGDTTCTSMGHRGIIILYIYILYVYIHTVDIVIIIHNGYITQNGMKSRSQDGGFNQKRTV
jgi:hypothetical protein